MSIYDDERYTVPTNSHLTKNWSVAKFDIDSKYKFVKKGFFYSIFSFLFYMLAMIIFYPITWIMYGIRVKGRKNLKGIKNAVFISNHVLMIDFIAINTHILFGKRPYFLVPMDTYKIPFVRRLIRLLRAVPIPEKPTLTKNFLRDIDGALSNGKSILICPEGSMWPYYNEIRPFMSGAFRFSVKNNIPVVPIVLTYRKPNWFYKMFGRKKPLVTINILPKVEYDSELIGKAREENLQDKTYKIMSDYMLCNSNDYGYISKEVRGITKDITKT